MIIGGPSRKGNNAENWQKQFKQMKKQIFFLNEHFFAMTKLQHGEYNGKHIPSTYLYLILSQPDSSSFSFADTVHVDGEPLFAAKPPIHRSIYYESSLFRISSDSLSGSHW